MLFFKGNRRLTLIQHRAFLFTNQACSVKQASSRFLLATRVNATSPNILKNESLRKQCQIIKYNEYFFPSESLRNEHMNKKVLNKDSLPLLSAQARLFPGKLRPTKIGRSLL